jgi:hypothetical protein
METFLGKQMGGGSDNLGLAGGGTPLLPGCVQRFCHQWSSQGEYVLIY